MNVDVNSEEEQSNYAQSLRNSNCGKGTMAEYRSTNGSSYIVWRSVWITDERNGQGDAPVEGSEINSGKPLAHVTQSFNSNCCLYWTLVMVT